MLVNYPPPPISHTLNSVASLVPMRTSNQSFRVGELGFEKHPPRFCEKVRAVVCEDNGHLCHFKGISPMYTDMRFIPASHQLNTHKGSWLPHRVVT